MLGVTLRSSNSDLISFSLSDGTGSPNGMQAGETRRLTNDELEINLGKIGVT
jgi:hypothetical protein